YLVPRHGAERSIASGEYPLGWTSGGLYTRRGRGGQLLLRGENGAVRKTLARRVYTYAYDQASDSLSFLVHGDADPRARRPNAAALVTRQSCRWFRECSSRRKSVVRSGWKGGCRALGNEPRQSQE